MFSMGTLLFMVMIILRIVHFNFGIIIEIIKEVLLNSSFLLYWNYIEDMKVYFYFIL